MLKASVGTEVAETVLGMWTPVPPTDAPALAGAAHWEGEGLGSRRVGERQEVLWLVWVGWAGLGGCCGLNVYIFPKVIC